MKKGASLLAPMIPTRTVSAGAASATTPAVKASVTHANSRAAANRKQSISDFLLRKLMM
jgi:hypothetical protein